MLLLLRTLFWGLVALWLWRRVRHWLNPTPVRRHDGAPPRPAPSPPGRDDPPLTNQPIEDADYEELP